jgi:hypothetical protein
MKVWHFDSTGDAYDATQCREEIKSGDILVIASEGVVGIADTWPFAITEAHGHLHTVEGDPTTYRDGKFKDAIEHARRNIDAYLKTQH